MHIASILRGVIGWKPFQRAESAQPQRPGFSTQRALMETEPGSAHRVNGERESFLGFAFERSIFRQSLPRRSLRRDCRGKSGFASKRTAPKNYAFLSFKFEWERSVQFRSLHRPLGCGMRSPHLFQGPLGRFFHYDFDRLLIYFCGEPARSIWVRWAVCK